MKYLSAGISFIFVFIFTFVLGGWFLMPYLPPVPDHPVTVFDAEYWMTNWAGALLGIIFGCLSARSVLKRNVNKHSKEPTRNLTPEETKILSMIQKLYGDQNSESDIFFTKGEAIIFVKASDGTTPLCANLTNLAVFRKNDSMPDEEFVKKWLLPPLA